MFGRRLPRPDPALLAQVSDATEVNLGTYQEDVLAVTGAYPLLHALDRRPDSFSAFRRLDSQARKAAMRSALDRLIAEGTLNVSPGASLEKVVADGIDGKLAFSGPLAGLYGLARWFHRRGSDASMIVSTWVTKGVPDVPMPSGVPPVGLETCLTVPPSGNGDVTVLLVERPDNQAGTRSYTLRTVRAEFSRLAAFLFADITTEGEGLGGSVSMTFRFPGGLLTEEAELARKHGDDVAIGRVTFETRQGRRKKRQEPKFYEFPRSDLPDLLTRQFTRVTR